MEHGVQCKVFLFSCMDILPHNYVNNQVDDNRVVVSYSGVQRA